MGQGPSSEERKDGSPSREPGRSQTFEQMQELSIELTEKLSKMSSPDLHFKFETKQKEFREFKFPLFWRSEVRVSITQEDNTPVRDLNFRQFNIIAAEIRALVDSDNSPPQLPLAPCSEKDVSCEDDDECPVCLDAHAGVALGCGHRFCEDCIKEWQSSDGTCPICRAGTKEDDLWVLTEGPTIEDIEAHIRGLVVGETKK